MLNGCALYPVGLWNLLYSNTYITQPLLSGCSLDFIYFITVIYCLFAHDPIIVHPLKCFQGMAFSRKQRTALFLVYNALSVPS